jgi:hypothetical protein
MIPGYFSRALLKGNIVLEDNSTADYPSPVCVEFIQFMEVLNKVEEGRMNSLCLTS